MTVYIIMIGHPSDSVHAYDRTPSVHSYDMSLK